MVVVAVCRPIPSLAAAYNQYYTHVAQQIGVWETTST